MLAAALLLIVTEPASPTLSQVMALPPSQAGDLLLRDKPHNRIVSFGMARGGGMNAPGFEEYDLVESPQRIPDGCVRRRWTVIFAKLPNSTTSDPVLFDKAWHSDEIALPTTPSCEHASYVGVNTNLDWHEALKIMGIFRRITTGEIPAKFTCKNALTDDVCATPEKTLTHLKTTPVWEVSPSSDGPELWLGHPGEAPVTVVKFSVDKPDQVSVTRKLPAPF
jgi:hypothetical protein